MYFDATPMNMTILLVVALAIIAIILLSRGRYDSNLPLLYFSAALAVTCFLTASVVHLLYPHRLRPDLRLSSGSFTKF
jgi:hypothetical protein